MKKFSAGVKQQISFLEDPKQFPLSLLPFKFLPWMALGGLLLLSTLVGANNDLVMIRVENNLLKAEHVVKGPLNLYVYSYLKAETIETGLRTVAAGVSEAKRFFLGVEGKIVEISPSNFKKTIKQYLPNAKYLHKRLGKVGFRFENLASMIKFYNNFRVKQQYAYAE